MKSFNGFIEDCYLFDLSLLNGMFTWANCRATMRIDKFLLSEVWIERFGCPRQIRGLRVTSDHWPLVLKFGD